MKNVNSGEDNGDAEGETKMSLLNVPVEEVFEVIEKVRALCKGERFLVLCYELLLLNILHNDLLMFGAGWEL